MTSFNRMEAEVSVEIGGEVYSGRIAKRGFLPDLTDWHPEGLGQIRLDGDRMIVDAPDGGFSVFWKNVLPADILVSYRVRSLPPYRQNNFNLISHCTPPRPGWPIVEGGRYPGYREFPNYIVTFVGDWEETDWGRDIGRGRIRFRRNPGFELKRERQTESVYGKLYHVIYVVNDGLIRYHLNGRKMEEWQDPAPLPGGFFALRTFCTTAEYSDLEILALCSV
ncbi:MAG: hypothetical protein N2255_04670 [Kiritimatiellae bacterium]|nr:hypothetical protein [Kiritimatiellia bacterium]